MVWIFQCENLSGEVKWRRQGDMGLEPVGVIITRRKYNSMGASTLKDEHGSLGSDDITQGGIMGREEIQKAR